MKNTMTLVHRNLVTALAIAAVCVVGITELNAKNTDKQKFAKKAVNAGAGGRVDGHAKAGGGAGGNANGGGGARAKVGGGATAGEIPGDIQERIDAMLRAHGGANLPNADVDKLLRDLQNQLNVGGIGAPNVGDPRKQVEQRLADAMKNAKAAMAEAHANVSVSRDGDGNVTIKTNEGERKFKLVNGKIPADIKKWLNDQGIEATVDDKRISVEYVAKAGVGGRVDGHAKAGGGAGGNANGGGGARAKVGGGATAGEIPGDIQERIDAMLRAHGGANLPNADVDKLLRDLQNQLNVGGIGAPNVGDPRKQVEQRLADAMKNAKAAMAEAHANVSVSRDGDGNVTIKTNEGERKFKLVNGKIPADIKKWLSDQGIEAKVDGDVISVISISKDVQKNVENANASPVVPRIANKDPNEKETPRDANTNSNILLDPVQTWMKRHGIAEMFRDLDNNQDNRLSRDETEGKQLATLFGQIDRDRDGFVTAGEIKQSYENRLSQE